MTVRRWDPLWLIGALGIVLASLLAVTWIRLGDLSEMLIENRAVACRGLIAEGVLLHPSGPCLAPRVRVLLDP